MTEEMEVEKTDHRILFSEGYSETKFGHDKPRTYCMLVTYPGIAFYIPSITVAFMKYWKPGRKSIKGEKLKPDYEKSILMPQGMTNATLIRMTIDMVDVLEATGSLEEYCE